MPTASNSDRPSIHSVTEAAAAAAGRGEWDQVDECYRQRASLLSHSTLAPDALARVLTLDRMVEEQIRVAQAGLMALLEEAAKTRQRIQGLRRWNGAISSDSGTIERHI